MDPIIRVHDVSKSFRDNLSARKVKALESISLSAEKGEVYGFLGPNGAGKSTTIKLLLNLIRPDSGSVTIAGRSVEERELRRIVGFLPENPYFYEHLTAEELLWFGGQASGMKGSEIKERSMMLLEKTDLLDARKRAIRTYSKGMVQRAGLALALVHDPEVIILDEPMSGLDPFGRRMVSNLIIDMKKAGKTVFFSSHILGDIEKICDKVGIIAEGRLCLEDSLTNLLNYGATLEDIFFAEVEKISVKGN